MDSCRHTPWAELKLSIHCGMFLHRDQGLTLINDVCACVYALCKLQIFLKTLLTFIHLNFIFKYVCTLMKRLCDICKASGLTVCNPAGPRPRYSY